FPICSLHSTGILDLPYQRRCAMSAPDSLPWSPAAAPIWAMVCHFDGEYRRQRKLLMLRAYFDDSLNDDVFVVAGFLASATTWAKFSDEWAEALNLAPRIHCFVMNDAMTMNGEFRHLREPQRDGKV